MNPDPLLGLRPGFLQEFLGAVEWDMILQLRADVHAHLRQRIIDWNFLCDELGW